MEVFTGVSELLVTQTLLLCQSIVRILNIQLKMFVIFKIHVNQFTVA